MDRITRKELKTDKFALEVSQTVTLFEEHRDEIVRYGGIALAVVALVAGYWVYSSHQHAARQAALAKAIEIQEAPAGAGVINTGGGVSFPTQEAKDAATEKAFTEIKSQYSGSTEADIAQYYLGCIEADKGNMAAAETAYKAVAQKGDERYGSLAKLSLAQIYLSDGRNSEAEKLLRDLMAHPTILVSKEQASLALCQYLVRHNQTEARKLLDQLRVSPSDEVRNVALNLLNELPPQ